jgi:hypothetical protein
MATVACARPYSNDKHGILPTINDREKVAI